MFPIRNNGYIQSVIRFPVAEIFVLIFHFSIAKRCRRSLLCVFQILMKIRSTFGSFENWRWHWLNWPFNVWCQNNSYILLLCKYKNLLLLLKRYLSDHHVKCPFFLYQMFHWGLRSKQAQKGVWMDLFRDLTYLLVPNRYVLDWKIGKYFSNHLFHSMMKRPKMSCQGRCKNTNLIYFFFELSTNLSYIVIWNSVSIWVFEFGFVIVK